MITCETCPKRDTCTEVCEEIENQLEMFGIHKADWKGCGAFANPWQRNKAKDMLYQRQLEANLKKGNRCPKCGRIVKYYRKKEKMYVCGHCPWEGKTVKRPEDYSPGPNTD